MPRVISKGPDKSVAKEVVCQGCGATIEYVPNDVVTLWSGTDYGGGPDGAEGFKCPECGKNVILKRW
jgi:predicted RNA-binding Zn-ribbon protein involved in translation (DUF1610 family)